MCSEAPLRCPVRAADYQCETSDRLDTELRLYQVRLCDNCFLNSILSIFDYNCHSPLSSSGGFALMTTTALEIEKFHQFLKSTCVSLTK